MLLFFVLHAVFGMNLTVQDAQAVEIVTTLLPAATAGAYLLLRDRCVWASFKTIVESIKRSCLNARDAYKCLEKKLCGTSLKSLQQKHDEEVFLAAAISKFSYSFTARRCESPGPHSICDVTQTVIHLKEKYNTIEFWDTLTDKVKATDDDGLKKALKNLKNGRELYNSNSNEKKSAGWGIVKVVHDSQTYLFVGFKGSNDVEDVMTNLKFKGAKNDELDVNVHQGMNQAFENEDLAEKVLKQLNREWKKLKTAEKSNSRLILTGHSLGGGYAQIFGAYLKNGSFLRGRNLDPKFSEILKKSKIKTFGAPHVFDLMYDTRLHTPTPEWEFAKLVIPDLDDTPSWVEPLEQHSEHYINSDDPIPFLNHITGRNIIETVYKNKKDLGKILDNDVSVKEKLASTFNAVKTYVGTNFQTWGTFYFFNREESNGYKAISFENLQKRADSNAMTGATTLAKKHSMDSYIMKFLEHKKRRFKLKY